MPNIIIKNKDFNLQLFYSLLIIFSIIIPIENLFSQNKYNFNQFSEETYDFIKQPVKWDIGDFGKLGLISLSTILTMQIDEDIRNKMMTDRSYYNSIPVEFGRIWGEPYTSISFAGFFALTGTLNNNSTNKKIAFEILQSMLYSGGIAFVSKTILGRARPYTNEGAFSYHPINFSQDKYWAHPSGHTTLAFSLSTILSKNSSSGLIKTIVYIPSVLTLFSRVYQDYHWASDVLLGAVIGYFTAEWIFQEHLSKNNMYENEVNQLIVFNIPL